MKTQGCYEMHKDFMIIFYTNAGDPNPDFDDSMIQMALDSTSTAFPWYLTPGIWPLVDTFERFYVGTLR